MCMQRAAQGRRQAVQKRLIKKEKGKEQNIIRKRMASKRKQNEGVAKRRKEEIQRKSEKEGQQKGNKMKGRQNEGKKKSHRKLRKKYVGVPEWQKEQNEYKF